MGPLKPSLCETAFSLAIGLGSNGLHTIHHPREALSLTSVLAESFARASGFCLLEACLVFSTLLQNSKGPEWLGASWRSPKLLWGESDPLQACRGLAELALQDGVAQPLPSQTSGHLPPGFRHEHLAGLCLGKQCPCEVASLSLYCGAGEHRPPISTTCATFLPPLCFTGCLAMSVSPEGSFAILRMPCVSSAKTLGVSPSEGMKGDSGTSSPHY